MKKITSNKKHCDVCEGKNVIIVTLNAIEQSRCDRITSFVKTCPLCEGKGYLEVPLKIDIENRRKK